MSGWKELTLTEAGITLIDCDHKTPSPANKGLPYVAIPQMKDGYIDFSEARLISEEDFEVWTRKANPQVHDVVLSRRCNPGESAYVAEGIKFALGQNLVLLRSDGKLVKKPFLRWLIKSPAWWAEVKNNINVGAVFNSLKCGEIVNFKLPIPPIEEQEEITKTLFCLDHKIEILRKQNETLEAIAQTLFKHWFVDFEFPNADGKPYKSSGGAMEPSELGDIPAGWCASTLGNEFDIAIGRTPPRKESEWFSTNATDIKWVSIKDMGSCGTYIFKTSEYLTREAVDQFNIPVIPANTVILSFKLTVGRVAITPEEMLSNEAIAHIKTSSDSIPSEYIYLFLSQFNFGKLGNTSSIATAVNSKSIKALEIIAPDSGIISKFYATVKPLFEKLKVNSQQIQTLTKTRDVLLPKLMSGKLRIKD